MVLYAWGRPKFRKVARAIHEAGVFLVLNQDNGGLVSPLAGFSGWWREQWILSGGENLPTRLLHFLKLVVTGLSKCLFITDPLRAAHLKQGDIIACVSPAAAVHYRRLCHIYGGSTLVNRFRIIPHPVETHFNLPASASPKTRQISCVGRWSDNHQKRTNLMMKVLDCALDDQDLRVEIIGETTAELSEWHENLKGGPRGRVILRGTLGRVELAETLRRSQVFYSPSAFESFGIAAGEALCCGCSVVAGRSQSMGSFEWFVSEHSGTLALSDDVNGHVEAIKTELASWKNGSRNPASISSIWCERLHADNLARQIVSLVTC